MKKLNIKISAKDVWKNGKAVKLYVFISLFHWAINAATAATELSHRRRIPRSQARLESTMSPPFSSVEGDPAPSGRTVARRPHITTCP
jgi:hypothetical protein